MHELCRIIVQDCICMEITIDKDLYLQAQSYAQQQGLSITAVIESFLKRFIRNSHAASEQSIPDIVLSLLGAGEPVEEDDINGQQAYYQHLTEKHQ